ncbi:hypothetical protein G9A89_009048 [Geosiphon pyriformis]|nr:hypothetical protein G9A89_009048 [Geosiphon pyriformis]
MWSNIRKLEHIAQQCEHCSRNHNTLLGNDIALVKDPKIRVEHLIEVSLPEETPAITLRKKLTKLWFWKAMDKTIITKSLSIIQRTQPKPSDKHTFRFPSSTPALSTKLQPPIELIIEPIQQQQISFQQPSLQQLIQQPVQQPQQQLQLPIQQQQLIMPMVFAPIAKLEKFTSEENNVQTWINDVAKAITANNWDDTKTIQVIPYFLKNTTNLWYYSLAQKPQNFNAFKTEFLRYFSNNNSINHLASTFTTQKQGDTEAVTTYLGCFYRNLHQIQAIKLITLQGLYSSILQQVCPMHPVDLSTTVTHARDFETTELEANHAQTVNLVMNGSSDLDSKLKQFKDVASSKQKTNQKPLICNISPAASTKDKSLAAIFPFKLEEIMSVLLFSRAILDTKPITTMYTDVKVDDSRSTGSIITKQLMDQLSCRVDRAASAKIITADGATKTSIGEIDDFSFEVNGIIVLIKVLIMEATQYQALIGNNWLTKTNTIFDWTMQEL